MAIHFNDTNTTTTRIIGTNNVQGNALTKEI